MRSVIWCLIWWDLFICSITSRKRRSVWNACSVVSSAFVSRRVETFLLKVYMIRLAASPSSLFFFISLSEGVWTNALGLLRLSGENDTSGGHDRACVCNKSGEGQWVDAAAVHRVGGGWLLRQVQFSLPGGRRYCRHGPQPHREQYAYLFMKNLQVNTSVCSKSPENLHLSSNRFKPEAVSHHHHPLCSWPDVCSRWDSCSSGPWRSSCPEAAAELFVSSGSEGRRGHPVRSVVQVCGWNFGIR